MSALNDSKLCDRCEEAPGTLECRQCAPQDDDNPYTLCDECNKIIHVGRSARHKILTFPLKARAEDSKKNLQEFLRLTSSIEDKLKDVKKSSDSVKEMNRLFERNLRKAVISVQQQLKERAKSLSSQFSEYCNAKTQELAKCHEALSCKRDSAKQVVDSVSKTLADKETWLTEALLDDLDSQLSDGRLEGHLVEFPDMDLDLMVDYSKVSEAIANLGLNDGGKSGDDKEKSVIEVPAPSISEGVEMSVTVSSPMNKDGTFWVLPELDEPTALALNSMSNIIRKMYVESTYWMTYDRLPKEPVVGEKVYARYAADQKWYRAQVEEVGTMRNACHVRFIDYGNSESVKYSDLIPMLEDLFPNCPPQSVECCLFRSLQLQLLQEPRWTFNQIVRETSVQCIFKSKIDDTERPVWYVNMSAPNEETKSMESINDFVKEKVETHVKPVSVIACRDIRLTENEDIERVIFTENKSKEKETVSDSITETKETISDAKVTIPDVKETVTDSKSVPADAVAMETPDGESESKATLSKEKSSCESVSDTSKISKMDTPITEMADIDAGCRKPDPTTDQGISNGFAGAEQVAEYERGGQDPALAPMETDKDDVHPTENVSGNALQSATEGHTSENAETRIKVDNKEIMADVPSLNTKESNQERKTSTEPKLSTSLNDIKTTSSVKESPAALDSSQKPTPSVETKLANDKHQTDLPVSLGTCVVTSSSKPPVSVAVGGTASKEGKVISTKVQTNVQQHCGSGDNVQHEPYDPKLPPQHVVTPLDEPAQHNQLGQEHKNISSSSSVYGSETHIPTSNPITGRKATYWDLCANDIQATVGPLPQRTSYSPSPFECQYNVGVSDEYALQGLDSHVLLSHGSSLYPGAEGPPQGIANIVGTSQVSVAQTSVPVTILQRGPSQGISRPRLPVSVSCLHPTGPQPRLDLHVEPASFGTAGIIVLPDTSQPPPNLNMIPKLEQQEIGQCFIEPVPPEAHEVQVTRTSINDTWQDTYIPDLQTEKYSEPISSEAAVTYPSQVEVDLKSQSMADPLTSSSHVRLADSEVAHVDPSDAPDVDKVEKLKQECNDENMKSPSRTAEIPINSDVMKKEPKEKKSNKKSTKPQESQQAASEIQKQQSLPQAHLYAGGVFRAKVVSDIDDRGQFWVELSRTPQEEDLYQSFMTQFRVLAKILTEKDEASPGENVVVKDERGAYQRVRIKEVLDKKMIVQCLDKGGEMTTSKVFEMHTFCTKFPFQAVFCSLATGEHPIFTQKARLHFSRIAKSKEFNVHFVNAGHRVTNVSLKAISDSSDILKIISTKGPYSGPLRTPTPDNGQSITPGIAPGNKRDNAVVGNEASLQHGGGYIPVGGGGARYPATTSQECENRVTISDYAYSPVFPHNPRVPLSHEQDGSRVVTTNYGSIPSPGFCVPRTTPLNVDSQPVRSSPDNSLPQNSQEIYLPPPPNQSELESHMASMISDQHGQPVGHDPSQEQELPDSQVPCQDLGDRENSSWGSGDIDRERHSFSSHTRSKGKPPSGPDGDRSRPYKGQVQSHGFQEYGHYRGDGPKSKKGTKNVVCFTCRNVGHMKNECPQKPRQNDCRRQGKPGKGSGGFGQPARSSSFNSQSFDPDGVSCMNQSEEDWG